jgi:hypothetical protein
MSNSKYLPAINGIGTGSDMRSEDSAMMLEIEPRDDYYIYQVSFMLKLGLRRRVLKQVCSLIKTYDLDIISRKLVFRGLTDRIYNHCKG